jgi:TolB protein
MRGVPGIVLSFAVATAAGAQTPPPPIATPVPQGDIVLTLPEGGRRLVLAVPELAAPGGLRDRVAQPFTATLRSDLEYAGVFAIADPAHYPAGSRDVSTTEAADRWRGTGAEVLVDTKGEAAGDRVSVEARVWDLPSKKMILGRRYTGNVAYVERIAHTLANDIVKHFTGRDGIFLSTIAFVSDRDGAGREIWAMDFDGRNPRKLTNHRSMSISPAGSSARVAYTSYVRLYPQIWLMNPDGSEKREISTGVDLNASPSLSPDGTQVAFAGSVKGNTDVYVIGSDGKNLRRLTTTRALEASPAWSPTGRQIAYTSDQAGTPQIWVVDAEGTGARRLSFAGNWNDEATWSPDGSRLAFACRNEGDFNICVMNVATGETVQLTSEGSNGRPSWSPDGQKIVYQSRRGSSTQIYTMDAADGANKRILTEGRNNLQPFWLR